MIGDAEAYGPTKNAKKKTHLESGTLKLKLATDLGHWRKKNRAKGGRSRM